MSLFLPLVTDRGRLFSDILFTYLKHFRVLRFNVLLSLSSYVSQGLQTTGAYFLLFFVFLFPLVINRPLLNFCLFVCAYFRCTVFFYTVPIFCALWIIQTSSIISSLSSSEDNILLICYWCLKTVSSGAYQLFSNDNTVSSEQSHKSDSCVETGAQASAISSLQLFPGRR